MTILPIQSKYVGAVEAKGQLWVAVAKTRLEVIKTLSEKVWS